MKVLVTGGAGCIGSDLATVLLGRGCDVTVLDNLSSGKLDHLRDCFSHPRFRFIEGDLLDREVVNQAVSGMEMVYHLAANPDVKFAPGEPTDKDLYQNTIATYNVLEAIRHNGVSRLAFASTSAVYGLSPIQPIPETAPARPISLYGATKLSCEAMISAFSNLFAIQSWVFRFANVVGAKVRKKGRTVISDFVHRLREQPRRLTILGDGRQAKSYLLADECISAMLYVIEKSAEPVTILNLGCDDSLGVTRIADMVVEAMGLSGVEYEYTGGEGGWPGDVPRFMLDVTALNRLGWRAGHSSEQAVRIAISEVLRHCSPSPAPIGGPICRP
jgi:UDP-glucose 4-epimerase